MRFFLSLYSIFFSAIALAQTIQSPLKTTTYSPWSGFLQMILALGFVLLLIFAFAWAAKRINPMRQNVSSHLRVIASTFVGEKEKVVIVEFGNQWYLLGVANQNVRLLKEIPKDESFLNDPVAVETPSFDKLLAKFRR